MKCVQASTNALYGCTDPIPAESRWTHTLPNFKRTILRKLLYSLGIDCWPRNMEETLQTIEVDGEAMDNHVQIINSVRMRKTRDYFSDDESCAPLSVFTNFLEVADGELLYPPQGGRPQRLPQSEV